jgi:hypothetical protein
MALLPVTMSFLHGAEPSSIGRCDAMPVDVARHGILNRPSASLHVLDLDPLPRTRGKGRGPIHGPPDCLDLRPFVGRSPAHRSWPDEPGNPMCFQIISIQYFLNWILRLRHAYDGDSRGAEQRGNPGGRLTGRTLHTHGDASRSWTPSVGSKNLPADVRPW